MWLCYFFFVGGVRRIGVEFEFIDLFSACPKPLKITTRNPWTKNQNSTEYSIVILFTMVFKRIYHFTNDRKIQKVLW